MRCLSGPGGGDGKGPTPCTYIIKGMLPITSASKGYGEFPWVVTAPSAGLQPGSCKVRGAALPHRQINHTLTVQNIPHCTIPSHLRPCQILVSEMRQPYLAYSPVSAKVPAPPWPAAL